ncbi:MFS transporter [Candidatus Uhrbacteria bacterium]|nr:MFS transporter [Candidatus Uhrbacteria bacterium]
MLSREAGRFIKHYKTNNIIKLLILSDFIIWSGNQLFAPIIAIFISDRLIGGSIEAAGIAVSIFLVVKSILEIPVGMFIDSSKSEKDDLYSAILGTLISSIAILLYSVITTVGQMYMLQVLLGAAAAIAYPGWYSIFTKHVDKNKEAFEWSLYDVMVVIGMAGTAAVGGFIANEFGFEMTFYIAAVATFSGALLLFMLKNKVK